MIGTNNNNNIIIPSGEITDVDDANNNNIPSSIVVDVLETIDTKTETKITTDDDMLPQIHHCSASNHDNPNVLCLSNNTINLFEIPISALGKNCRRKLSFSLNAIKVILSEDGVQRDWRGVHHYLHLESLPLGYLQTRDDKMGEMLEQWQIDCKTASLGELQKILGDIDRWDVVDDTSEMFGKFFFFLFFSFCVIFLNVFGILDSQFSISLNRMISHNSYNRN